jgi:hypothetical protein
VITWLCQAPARYCLSLTMWAVVTHHIFPASLLKITDCHRSIAHCVDDVIMPARPSNSSSRHALSVMYPGVDVCSLTERYNTPGRSGWGVTLGTIRPLRHSPERNTFACIFNHPNLGTLAHCFPTRPIWNLGFFQQSKMKNDNFHDLCWYFKATLHSMLSFQG